MEARGASSRPQNAFTLSRRPVNGARQAEPGFSGIPEVHTSHAQEVGLSESTAEAATNEHQRSVTLEDITNVDAFVGRLEKIELPNQLIAVLADPLLQKLLLLKPDLESYQRVGNWLASFAHDALDGEADSGIMDILETLADYTSRTKVSLPALIKESWDADGLENTPPIMIAFWGKYLKVWNGRDGRDVILRSLSYVPLTKLSGTFGGFSQG